MKKLLIIALCLFIFSCGNNAGKKLDDQKFNAFLAKQITSQSDTINMVDFNDFDWDKLYVLPPYTKVDSDDKLLTSAASTVADTHITIRDDVSILVFFYQNKCVGTMEISRKIDFASVGETPKGSGRSFDRKDCKFKYLKLAGGDFVQLTPL